MAKKQALIIKTKSGRFRRAGIAFTEKETTVLVTDLEKGQQEILEKEPLLIVKKGQIDVDEKKAD